MAIIQPLLDLVEICAQKGIRFAVISPGSRSAALTLGFARHPAISTLVVPDERSAAYIGLGLSQALQEPVALVCTSGTAALNFAPAVAEAYFNEVPLLILTCDRPATWLNQQDGQMINQQRIFEGHVKQQHQLPDNYIHSDSEAFTNRMLNQSINSLTTNPPGPVHINIPIREPFYPVENEEYYFNKNVRIIEAPKTIRTLLSATWEALIDEIQLTENVLIAVGQGWIDSELNNSLHMLVEEFSIPVIVDVISNGKSTNFIDKQDIILSSNNSEVLEKLRPELVITFGNSFISKNLKLFLRKSSIPIHWHLQFGEIIHDPFQSVTRIIQMEPAHFFKQVLDDLDMQQFREGDSGLREGNYLAEWQKANSGANKFIESEFSRYSDFNEFSALHFAMENLPETCDLHLSNSMVVRYANFIGIPKHKNIRVYSNRGTSGIDGCLSTAVGAAIASQKPVFLFIGDVAFFYDRNGLWHPHVSPNLRIVLFNNHGGGIFRMIEGPAKLPERAEFFETTHGMNAKRTCEDARIVYFSATNWEELRKNWPAFILEDNQSKLLEIETDGEINERIFMEFRERGQQLVF